NLTFAILLLAVILTVWLGISGPIRFSDLKDWQPLIASCVALLAAGLAYRGATAKVNFDREIAEATMERRRINLMNRLDYELYRLDQGIILIGNKAKDKDVSARDLRGSIEAIGFDSSPEVKEAWENGDLLEPRVIE